jgi:hypothetical protein
MSEAWPRLSKSLTGPRRHGLCQSCGVKSQDHRGLPSLTLWQECGDQDDATIDYLWLCHPCAERLIEPHPRLYQRHHVFHPAVGVQPFCETCIHCVNMRCTHRDANLGTLVQPGAFSRAFVDGQGRGKSGRRVGWIATLFYEPAKGCRGREEGIEL